MTMLMMITMTMMMTVLMLMMIMMMRKPPTSTNDQPELCRWGSGYALLPDTHQPELNQLCAAVIALPAASSLRR